METKKECIEVVALLKTLEETSADMFDDFDGDYRAESGFSRKALDEIIAAIPTADVTEVVHGRWEPVDHDGSWRVDKCSICSKRLHYVDYGQPYPYCPNCGTKMDLEEK